MPTLALYASRELHEINKVLGAPEALAHVHFHVARLHEAKLDKPLEPRLALWPDGCAEKRVGTVPQQSLTRIERLGVHQLLYQFEWPFQETAHPPRKSVNERIEFSVRDRSVDPAVSFGRVGVEILTPAHDLERSRPTHQG